MLRRIAPTFRLIAAMAALVLAAGCSAPLPSTDLPPTRIVEPVPGFPNLRDYRGEIDCRIRAAGLDEVKAADLAKDAQIDFITFGDPVKAGAADFGVGGFTNQILFIPGGSFATGGGEIVAVNVHAPIDPGQSPAAVIGSIHDQGGLAIAADPAAFKSPDDYALADAVEIYNQQSTWAGESSTSMYLRAILFGTDHFLGDLDVRPAQNLAVYDRMAAGARVTLLAGLGAPENMPVLGSKVGTLEQLFRFYTTHLLAPERNIDPLVDALKHGHSYVSFDVLGYVGQFGFYAQSGDAKALMGDEVTLASGLTLEAELPGAAERIVLIENGTKVASAENADHLAYVPTSPGAYRIEAYRKGRPWILSNPVYVR
jgi:hypothetical protein